MMVTGSSPEGVYMRISVGVPHNERGICSWQAIKLRVECGRQVSAL